MKLIFQRWVVMFTLVGALIVPAVALADNCGSYSDCYDTGRAAAEAAAALAILGIILSTALDVSPVGPLKAAYQAATGEDMITHEKVNRWEQVLGVIPVGKIIGLGAKGAMHFAHDTARVARATEKLGQGLARAGQAAAKLSQQSDSWRAAAKIGRTAGQAWDVKEKIDNIKAVGEAGQKIRGVIKDTGEKLASLGGTGDARSNKNSGSDSDVNDSQDPTILPSPAKKRPPGGGGAGTASR